MKNGLDLYNECYSPEERIEAKAKAFDEIASMFYDFNFGTSTKSEIELKLFSILMDAMIRRYTEDGVLNYSICSNYNIGKSLGIQPSKVNTLKKNKQARYWQEFDWQKSLLSVKDGIRYENKKIIIPMPDPNLYIEIKNYIEEKGGYIKISHSDNLMTMRPEFFFLLIYYGLDSENDREKIKKELAKAIKEKSEDDFDCIKTDSEVNKRAIELGVSTLDLLETVAEGITNPLVGIIKVLKLGSNLLK